MAYKYLVLDSLGRPVARCMSPEGLDAPVWRLETDTGVFQVNGLTREVTAVLP